MVPDAPDLTYWLTHESPPDAGGHTANTPAEGGPVRLLAEVIIDEARITAWPEIRLAHLQPQPMHIVDTTIDSHHVDEATVTGEGTVRLAVAWRLTVTFADVDGEEHRVRRDYRVVRDMTLRSARPGMGVEVEPALYCRQAELADVGRETMIRCRLALAALVRLTRKEVVEIPAARILTQWQVLVPALTSDDTTTALADAPQDPGEWPQWGGYPLDDN